VTYTESVAFWMHAKAQMQFWQNIERDLRQQVFNASFKSAKEGANNLGVPPGTVFDLPTDLPTPPLWEPQVTKEGAKLAGTFKINRTLDRERYHTLSAKELSTLLDNHIVKLEPAFQLSNYRDAPEEVRKLADTLVKSAPGLPDLELKLGK
jgi:hypothetical protein